MWGQVRHLANCLSSGSLCQGGHVDDTDHWSLVTGQSIPRVSVGVMVRTEEMQTGDRAQYTQTVIGRQIDRQAHNRQE